MAISKLKKLSDQEKTLILEEFKNLLNANEEVVFALLYGSMVDPVEPDRYGDIDIALYVNPERLQTPEYKLESQIEAEAFRTLSAKGVSEGIAGRLKYPTSTSASTFFPIFS